ncbi:amidase family protein [Halomonas sp. HK25]|uniref:amidase family protein n=1 Tax=Halomonas sp. HK25 TaxID=3394321 RepID=UPI0039FD239C
MYEPFDMTMAIVAFRNRLVSGESQPLDWWHACRERIEAREPEVLAWEALASSPPAPPAAGLLQGVPVGLKDIIETRDLPTAWGTGGYLSTPGSLLDAALVTLLEQQGASELRQVLSRVFVDEVDVILAASAQEVAPDGLDATSDPLYCRAWTLLGVPCLNLPLGRGHQGLPVGVQLIGDRFQDDRLLAIARTLMQPPPGQT